MRAPLLGRSCPIAMPNQSRTSHSDANAAGIARDRKSRLGRQAPRHQEPSTGHGYSRHWGYECDSSAVNVSDRSPRLQVTSAEAAAKRMLSRGGAVLLKQNRIRTPHRSRNSQKPSVFSSGSNESGDPDVQSQLLTTAWISSRRSQRMSVRRRGSPYETPGRGSCVMSFSNHSFSIGTTASTISFPSADQLASRM